MANWTQEELESVLLEQGWWNPGDQRPVANGIQYRLTDGTPVSFYPSTGRVLVQGRETPLRHEVQALLESISLEAVVPESSPVVVPSGSQAGGLQPRANLPKRVFIVYGHDVTARDQLELILLRLRLEPIVLQNLSGGGDTIIENLDSLTNADFACVLLTPDDEGRLQGSQNPLSPRARQNVVLELGMVLARLGRQRVAILVKDTKGQSIERPTDIEGIIYIPFEEHINEAKNKLAARLQEAGFEIKVADLVD